MGYFEKANELFNNKDYINAIEMYQKSADSNQNQASSLYNSAVCFIKLKKFNNSILKLKQAIKLKRDSKYFYNLAYCYTMIKNYKKALIYFNMAWCLKNDDSDCKKAIDLILSRIKRK